MAGRIQQIAFNFTTGTQYSPWIRHDYYQDPFDVSLSFYLGSGLAGTFAVQYALDDMTMTAQRTSSGRDVMLSQTTTVISVTDPGPLINIGSVNAAGALVQALGAAGHGLAVGDYVQLMGTPNQGQLDGGYSVASVVSANSYTLTSALSQTLPLTAVKAITGRVQTHATMTGMTARTSGNYIAPVFASRLLCSAFTSGGYGFLVAMQGGMSS